MACNTASSEILAQATKGGRMLVAYLSRSGNTRVVAGQLKRAFAAALRIEGAIRAFRTRPEGEFLERCVRADASGREAVLGGRVDAGTGQLQGRRAGTIGRMRTNESITGTAATESVPLTGHHLQWIVTDGCPGLTAALQIVYPGILGQRCWVNKMRNILAKVQKRRASARHAFLRFRKTRHPEYPAMVRQLERDIPELLAFYRFPKLLWRKLRTTNLIERAFVAVRRRTRPMVCFLNIASVDRIMYSIFQRFHREWRNRTLRVLTQAA